MNQHITAVDIAQSAGLSDSTVRRYLKDVYPKSEPRTRQKFEASQMADLVALCRAQQKRKRLNRFNAIPKP